MDLIISSLTVTLMVWPNIMYDTTANIHWRVIPLFVTNKPQDSQKIHQWAYFLIRILYFTIDVTVVCGKCFHREDSRKCFQYSDFRHCTVLLIKFANSFSVGCDLKVAIPASYYRKNSERWPKPIKESITSSKCDTMSSRKNSSQVKT